jgi:hypothetical protein
MLALNRPRLGRRVVWLALFAVAVATIPYRLCANEADDWYRGDADTQRALQRSLEETIARPLTTRDFPTGSRVIDGEWLFGTYMMAAMGFGQLALEHPNDKAAELALIHHCIAKLISREVRAFDRDAWGSDPLALDGDDDHGSYLGYLNLVLSLDRLLEPDGEYAPLNERITATLARRLARAPSGLLESYHHAVFPVDNAAVIASIALHDRAVASHEHAPLVERFCARLRREWRDNRTGLLRQTMPRGVPRGSGTALAAYFLGWADPALSAELVAAMKRELYGAPLGFGAMREYAAGQRGRGDADSGPLIAGFSVGATGFALGAARMNDDAELFARLFATVRLFGAPVAGRDGARHFAGGGSIGNAIMFAMLTAPRRPR